jgi:K+-sensing histidine kinase KdpD
LRTRERHGRSRSKSSDDGFGVDEAARASLFQRFANGFERGIGHGARACTSCAGSPRRRAASVRYEPRAPRGSVFVLTLPKADSAAHR